jgi:threonine/homoserine/homoserine lactone efflux protein
VAAAAGWFSDRLAREAPLITPGVRRVGGVLLVVLGVWTVYNGVASGWVTL